MHHNCQCIASVFFSRYILPAMAFFTLIINFIVLLTIVSSKKLRKHKSNKFFLCLLTAHVLSSSWQFSESILYHVTGISNFDYVILLQPTNWRLLHLTAGGFCLASPFPNMCLVVFMRYIAVRHPFYYQRITKLFVFTSTIVIAVVPLVIGVTLYLLFGVKIIFVSVIIVGHLTPLIMIYIHGSVYIKTRMHLKIQLQNLVQTNTQAENKRIITIRKKQLRSLRICILLASTFLICWTAPVAVVSMFMFNLSEITLDHTSIVLGSMSINSFADSNYLCRFQQRDEECS